MKQRFRFCLFAILALPALALARPDAVDACAECHGADGMGKGDPMIPVLAGIPAGHIEEAVFAYIDGARRCVREPKMCETVAEFDEDLVFDIANYYGAKERQALDQDFDEKLAEEGAALHRQHCGACHARPDSRQADFAIGIPLHGQRKEYLRFAIEAYLAGDREALLPAMAHELGELEAGDIGALVNYYASYRPADAGD